MPFYQYVGDYHTQVRLEKNGEKVKVREGEIVESDLPAKYFVGNGFKAVNGEGSGDEAPTLTVNQLKDILTERGVEFPKNAKKADLEALVASSETPEVTVTATEDGSPDINLSVENGEGSGDEAPTGEDTGETGGESGETA